MIEWKRNTVLALVLFIGALSSAMAGVTVSVRTDQTSVYDHTTCDNSCNSDSKGMPRYRVHTMLVSLNIVDTPVGYTPPRGPAVPITFSYQQREANQPSTYNFANLGRNWTFNWLSYVQDDPRAAGSNVRLFYPGGGSTDFEGYDASTQTFTKEQRTGAYLVRVNDSQYERRMPDGTVFVYQKSDEKTSYPRRIFLTRLVDPAGHAVTLNYDSQLRLVSLVDAVGQTTTFTYGLSDIRKITSVTDPFGRKASITYDGSGRLKSITDAIGMTSTFGYDTQYFIKSMTTPYGTTKFAYGESGTTRWLEITDPKSGKERLEYRHSAPNIPYTESLLPDDMIYFNQYINSRNTFYWDKEAMKRQVPGKAPDYRQARIYHWFHWRRAPGTGGATTGVLESIKAPLENRIWYNYPGQGWAGAEGKLDKPSKIGQVLPDGTTQLTQMFYNNKGNVTRMVDPENREYQLDYASNGIDVIQVRRKNGSQYETLATLTYNDRHQPLTYTGPDGQLTTLAYNAAGQLISMTNALNQTTRYDYDANGYLAQIVDANGHAVVVNVHDAIGRLVSSTDAAGYQLHYAYDDLDRLVKVTYPDATTQTIVYNKLDIASVTDRHGNTTQYTYDGVRNLTKTIDPALHETLFTYFGNGLRSGITDPNNQVTRFLRDIQGRLTSTVHADTTETRYQYDTSGRQIRTVDPAGGSTELGYTKDNKIAQVTDPAGHVTRYAYNHAAELVRIDSPDSGTSLFGYDLNGNQISRTDAKGQLTAYAYDALNRLSQVRYADGQVVDYRYDQGSHGIGRLSSISEASVVTRFGYDAAGHVTDTIQAYPDGVALGVSVTYTNSGLPQTVTYPSGAVVRYIYANDRLQSISYNGVTVLDHLTYAAIGKPSGWLWSNGLIQGLGYEPTGRLNEYRLPDSDQMLGYDERYNLVSVEGDGQTQQYAYDDLNRLIAAQSASYDLGYRYDANGNRLASTDGSSTTTYAMAADSNRLTARQSTPIPHDANGSILGNGTHQYRYDSRGRLTALNGDAASYYYNDLGQRVAKKSQQRYQLTADINQDGQVTEQDIHALQALIAADASPLAADLNQDGEVTEQDIPCIATLIGASKSKGQQNQNANNGKGQGGPHACRVGEWITTAAETRFVYDGSRLLGEYAADGTVQQEHIWMGNQPVATVVNGKVYLVHTDHLGTPKAISDASQTIVWRWDARPFGDNRADSDPDGDGKSFRYNLRMPGQYYDQESGLHYNYFRDYDPALGRYVQSDPIGLRSGLNTYTYTLNNPLYWIDPFGLDTLGIHSNVEPTAGITAGHAWLSYTDAAGNVTNYGLWPDSHPMVPDNGSGSDVRTGMENGQASLYSRYYDLTPEQIKRWNDFLNRLDEWSYSHTCADWASDGVRDVIGENVDADDWLGFETPRELSESIRDLESGSSTSPSRPLPPLSGSSL